MTMVDDPKPVRFSLLRVLDLTSPLFTMGVYVEYPYLSHLVLLKYVAFVVFDETLVSEGPSIVFTKNQKLQTVVVSHSGRLRTLSSHLPSTIWRSPELRHLEFRNSLFVEPPSMVKEKLQTVYWLSIFHCTEEVFSRIPNISTLGIFCEVVRSNIDNGSSSCKDPNNLENLCHLNRLKVLTIEAEYAIPNRISLPGIDAFPCNLRKLKLSKTYLPWKDIATIALLPGLEVLKLKTDALNGYKWESTDGGFQRLKFLLLENAELSFWDASEDEFPILEHLVLKHCVSLYKIPSAFSNINSLQTIDLERCPPSVVSCAESIQQEQRDYGNDGLVVLYRTPQYTRERRMISTRSSYVRRPRPVLRGALREIGEYDMH